MSAVTGGHRPPLQFEIGHRRLCQLLDGLGRVPHCFTRLNMATAAETALKPRPRLPEWLRAGLPTSDTFARTRSLLEELKLHTVCESARCPNHWECWSKGTATFMIAGDRCTRACGFCAVATAKPFALEADEPARVAEATRRIDRKSV